MKWAKATARPKPDRRWSPIPPNLTSKGGTHTTAHSEAGQSVDADTNVSDSFGRQARELSLVLSFMFVNQIKAVWPSTLPRYAVVVVV